MAFHGPGETPTDEPFQRFLGPTEVASDVQSAIGACWHNVPADERSF